MSCIEAQIPKSLSARLVQVWFIEEADTEWQPVDHTAGHGALAQ